MTDPDKIVPDGDKITPPDGQPDVVTREELDRVLAKNDELLGKLKKYKTAAEEAEEKARLDAEEAEKKAREKLEENGNWKELYEADKVKWEAENTTLKDQLSTHAKEKEVAKVERELNTFFDAADIAPDARQILREAWLPQFKTAEDGTLRNRDNVTMSDYLSQWRESGQAAMFVKAPSNAGGGTTSGSGPVGATPKYDTITDISNAVREGKLTETEAAKQRALLREERRKSSS